MKKDDTTNTGAAQLTPECRKAQCSTVPPPGAGAYAVLCALLAFAVIAVYARTYRYGFIDLDDNAYVFENMMVKRGLTAEGVKWAFTTFYSANWHPLTWLSHMLDVELYGLNAGPHHLVNVGLHVLSTVLLFLALLRLTSARKIPDLWRSWLVAALFAVHPLHVESVAWIAERKDVLSTFFGVLALFFYAGYARSPGWRRYVPVLVSFALGLMAKSMLVTLPFVFLLLDYWPLGRIARPFNWRDARRLVAEKLPLFAMVAAVCVATFVAQQTGGAVSNLARLPLGDRFATAVIAYAAYIGKAFWPVNLAVLYPYAKYSAAMVLAAVAVLVAVTVAATILIRRFPYLIVGWLWYLGMLVPVIGLVQVGAQSMADRYTYLPLVGLSVAVVWLVEEVVRKNAVLRESTRYAAPVVLVVFAVLAFRQVTRWQSSRVLFEHTLAVTDRNYVIHKSLATVYEKEGRTDDAIAEYEKSLAIKPNFEEAHNNLGMVLDELGRRDEAMAHYEKALAAKPDYAEAHNNIGARLDREGKAADAIAHYERAVSARPDFAEAHKNLAVLLDKLGRHDEAAAHYRAALAINPYYADVYNNSGVALAAEGKTEQAMAQYKKALELAPDYPEAHANLGHELMRSGRLDEAFAHVSRAVELKPSMAGAQADLGTLLAAQKEFDKAKVHLEESLRLDPGSAEVHSNLGFVLLWLGQPGPAEAQCREAIRLKEDSVDPHFNLGMALATQGRMPEAAAEFTRVLQLNPDHAAAKAAIEQLQKGQ